MNDHRCPWARTELEILYHDQQWGRPEHDDRSLFEMLILEGLQAGLSWSLILRRREGLRRALDGFDPEIMAAYGPDKLAALAADPDMIKNRAKIRALADNARAFLAVQREFGSFDRYLWNLDPELPLVNHWRDISEIPAQSELSRRLSRDLKKRGFKFVGPVICYAYMQAVGLVNDHLVGCPGHRLCQEP